MDKPRESLIASESTPSTRLSRKKKRSSMDGVSWSRSGCLTCKKRRKRCDEAKPSCGNCSRLGRVCEGYGSVWTEPLGPMAPVFQQSSRSKRRRLSSSSSEAKSSIACSDVFSSCSPSSLQPASTPNTSACSSPYSTLSSSSLKHHDPCSPNTGLVCVCDSNTPRSPGHERENQGVVISSSTGDNIHAASLGITKCFSHLSTRETYYLQYHVEQGSKLLANLENDENPLRSLLIPRALSSPLVLNAVCAVSAIHLSNRLHDSGMGPTHATATNYYVQALHGLRTAISSYSTGTGLFPEEPILTIALLCKYEIVRGSVKQWASHLDALQKIIMSCGGFGALNRDTAEYLRGLMVYCGHMAKITNRGNKDTAKDALIYDPGILNIPTKLDIYVGYTEEILKIFARIADLYSLESDLEALDLEIFSINESLRIWTHTAKEYIIPKGMTQSNLSRLKMVADCFRDAAYIFLHSTLERMSQQQQPESDSKAATLAHLSSTWACLAYLSKSEAVHRCLHRVGSSSLDSHCEYSALTFPLFIAGCESEIPVERELVMRSLDKLEENFGIGNVKRAKELLQTFWGRQGEQRQHWMDALEQLRWELILA